MAETQGARRCPTWIKIVLGLSLALNLAIVGLVAGVALRSGPPGGRTPAMGYALPYVIALPREDRRAVFDAVRQDKSLPDRRARRADYAAMMEALQAAPFDRDAVQTILARQGEGGARVQRAAQAQWLDVVETMSQDERVEYVQRIQDVLKRGRKNKRR